eukprot:1151688-Pelagomonas_calceolata.AAC.5
MAIRAKPRPRQLMTTPLATMPRTAPLRMGTFVLRPNSASRMCAPARACVQACVRVRVRVCVTEGCKQMAFGLCCCLVTFPCTQHAAKQELVTKGNSEPCFQSKQSLMLTKIDDRQNL